jgi:hypothetical protein
MYSNVLSLVPQLTADRTATLAAFDERTDPARVEIASLAIAWSPLAEQLARLDPKKLQPRLVPAYHNLVARVQTNAMALRDRFDHLDTPDLTGARRAAVAARADSEFASTSQLLERETARFVASVEYARDLTEKLKKDLTTLESAGDAIYSDEFTVPPMVSRPFIAAR